MPDNDNLHSDPLLALIAEHDHLLAEWRRLEEVADQMFDALPQPERDLVRGTERRKRPGEIGRIHHRADACEAQAHVVFDEIAATVATTFEGLAAQVKCLIHAYDADKPTAIILVGLAALAEPRRDEQASGGPHGHPG